MTPAVRSLAAGAIAYGLCIGLQVCGMSADVATGVAVGVSVTIALGGRL